MLNSAQVVKTLVNFATNSPSQEYTHPDDHTSPTYDSPTVQKGLCQKPYAQPKGGAHTTISTTTKKSNENSSKMVQILHAL